jgi:hypothetical protein
LWYFNAGTHSGHRVVLHDIASRPTLDRWIGQTGMSQMGYDQGFSIRVNVSLSVSERVKTLETDEIGSKSMTHPQYPLQSPFGTRFLSTK